MGRYVSSPASPPRNWGNTFNRNIAMEVVSRGDPSQIPYCCSSVLRALGVMRFQVARSADSIQQHHSRCTQRSPYESAVETGSRKGRNTQPRNIYISNLVITFSTFLHFFRSFSFSGTFSYLLLLFTYFATFSDFLLTTYYVG